ncbi:sgf11p [Saccharomyces arboricola H-6]|uniref:SAGA-associated factor 11 n=1 Tax=Saccharomyces arboricola (strain H-6 / AS 2.3317 / CBS 10644) TaxID=1160507 RepID=J8LH60_SACAR|nr:sgf11p [Saccharomyces arboricola H-6]
MTEETITIDSISNGILNNLLTTLIQDIVARETTQEQLLKTRYPDLHRYYYDPNGSLDINGLRKQQESSQYIHCENCGRDVSANRLAAHLQRCLSRGARR